MQMFEIRDVDSKETALYHIHTESERKRETFTTVWLKAYGERIQAQYFWYFVYFMVDTFGLSSANVMRGTFTWVIFYI